MTPYELAQEVLATVETELGEATPAVKFAKLGAQVVDCESLIVAATGLEPSALPNCECGSATIVVTLARDCANEANQDGSNNPEAISSISSEISGDGTALTAVAKLWLQAQWSIGWSIQGGIAITSLQLTIPLPCG
jgi:hypothetical protein